MMVEIERDGSIRNCFIPSRGGLSDNAQMKEYAKLTRNFLVE